MAQSADINLVGTPSFIARSGNKLVIGTEGDQDIEFVRNNAVVFRVTSAGIIAQFDLPNDTWFQGRNAANTADVNILKIDTSNNLEIGTNLATNTEFLTNGTVRLINDHSSGALRPASVGSWSLGTAAVPFSSVIAGTGTINTSLSASAGESAGVVGTTTNHALSIRSNGTTRLTLASTGARLTAATGNNFDLAARAGNIDFYSSETDVAPTRKWRVMGTSPSGALMQDATNGGDIVMAKASTSVRQTTVTGITAAGTASGDATALTGVVNNVTTVAAATGVRLWAAGVGSVIHVKNSGANALLVYPDTGGTIDGGGTDAGVSIATGAVGTFYKTAALTWVASEAGAA